MKKEIYICDKCGKELTDVVYTLTCFADDISSTDGRIKSEVANQNMRQNLELALWGERKKHLCGECKDTLTDGLFIV